MQKPIAIPMEDPIIHTDEHPFCSDCSCPCHDIQDGQYYELIAKPLLGGLMTPEEANRLYFGELPLYEQASEPTPLDYEALEDYEPYYGRAEAEADAANAAYYDQVAQERNATIQTQSGEWW